ncbi:MAG: hypothetical protein LBC41_08495 [Clostridiales bacterium]|jgi:hypothetical protein|nr:hypothetical protein [Clostridiales bacterium]
MTQGFAGCSAKALLSGFLRDILSLRGSCPALGKRVRENRLNFQMPPVTALQASANRRKKLLNAVQAKKGHSPKRYIKKNKASAFGLAMNGLQSLPSVIQGLEAL